MGVAQTCCVQQNENSTPIMISTIEKQQKQQPQEFIQLVSQQSLKPPVLSENVLKNLQSFNPFADQLVPGNPIKKFDQILYEGPVNQQGKPEGYGKIYYKNGAVFVGKFQNGIANGPGHYVNIYGSCYRGNIKNKKADDQNGEYQSNQPDRKFKYKGAIKNNQFNGNGVEEGENYRYEGVFKNGKIQEGRLTWKQLQKRKLPLSDMVNQVLGDCTYQGAFDEDELFTGRATLTNFYGKYEGQFLKGKKNGNGKFIYKNGLTYIGTYVNDEKQGTGELKSKKNQTAYNGEFKNGLPHGKGWVPLPNGQKNYMNFVNGISSQIQNS